MLRDINNDNNIKNINNISNNNISDNDNDTDSEKGNDVDRDNSCVPARAKGTQKALLQQHCLRTFRPQYTSRIVPQVFRPMLVLD